MNVLVSVGADLIDSNFIKYFLDKNIDTLIINWRSKQG